jgi:hypothetical protein
VRRGRVGWSRVEWKDVSLSSVVRNGLLQCRVGWCLVEQNGERTTIVDCGGFEAGG